MKPPIIIIAAGRSGTKILRDMLCTHSKLVTWPCDEINPIWRYGSARYPTDELPPERATPKVKSYIHSKFEKILNRCGGERAVEKTCANSLRVEYVFRVFPAAQFIHLIRDGRDVVASARRRWSGEAELEYMLRKARWIPLADIPYYGFQFAWNRLYRLLNSEKQLQTWGPRFSGIDELARTKSLIEVCGIQWAKCIEAARRGLGVVSSSQVFEIKYEALVQDPVESFGRIFEFCGLEYEERSRTAIQQVVTTANAGKWQKELSGEDLDRLMSHIHVTLEREGYLA